MTLPVSGAISLNDVNVELYRSSTTIVYLNETVVRTLLEKTTPASVISMSDGYGKFSRVPLALTISANIADYNAFVAAGSPGGSTPYDVTLTINTGVICYATTTGTAALRVGGSWPAGSTFVIVNNGYIIGAGGAGGAGGAYSNGAAGGAGGNAIDFAGSGLTSVTVNNTAGYIYGGGGGGGGGGSNGWWTGYSEWLGGGGGGGGAGNVAGGGGANPGYYIVASAFTPTSGTSGTAGSSVGGTGGLGWDGNRDVGGESPSDHRAYGGDGGNGGGYGEAGAAGTNATSFDWLWALGSYVGNTAGAAGKAINLGGVSISWSGGNNITQVKGVVT